MAGSGRRVFQPGEVLTASNVMNYLQDQAVQVYAGTAARGSAIGTAVSEGMVSYLADTNAVEVYTGSNWNQLSQAISPNYIINGGFDIWQRGTSFAGIATGLYSVDRWVNFWDGTGSARTISQQYLDPASFPGVIDNGSFFARYQQTTAGSGATYNMFNHRIENVRALAGKTVTVSFYAKSAANLTMPVIYLIQRFGTGGSSEVITTVASNIAITTSWVRYSYTVTMPAITGKTINDTDSYTQLQIQLPINTTFTWDVFGVQLEAGSTATPFRRNANSIQGELAACQRYYRNLVRQNGSTFWGFLPLMWTPSATSAELYADASNMRNTPSVEISSIGHFIEQRTGSVGSSYSVASSGWPYSGIVNISISGLLSLVAGGAANFRAQNSSAYLSLSAEL